MEANTQSVLITNMDIDLLLLSLFKANQCTTFWTQCHNLFPNGRYSFPAFVLKSSRSYKYLIKWPTLTKLVIKLQVLQCFLPREEKPFSLCLFNQHNTVSEACRD